MRATSLGLFFGCMVAAALFGTPQSGRPRETIWLGSDLILGMPEETAVAKLAESYSLRKMDPPAGLRAKGVTSMWVVDEKGQGTKHSTVGVVTFAAGKLSNVHKDLLPLDADEVEFGRQVYFAMRDLEIEGNSRCTIETENGEVPDFANKTAKLRCGRKTVIIDVQKVKGYPESVQLSEELDAQ